MPAPSSLLKVVQVLSELEADMDLVQELAEAGLIELQYDSSGEAVVSSRDAERIRVVRLLTAELGVNLAGAEVIVHMREAMMSMQQQVEEILAAVAEEIRRQQGG